MLPGYLTTTAALRALETSPLLTVLPACTGGMFGKPRASIPSYARSLSPTLAGTARELGISLYPSGGMSSDTFVYGAAVDAITTERERMAVVYVGDYDPAGLQIADTLET